MKALDKKGTLRFFRYVSVGVSTFLFDMLLLYIATTLLGVPYYISTPIAFLIAMTINYLISRRFVFTGTERKIHHGYMYYVVLGVSAASVITGLVTILVEHVGFNYLVARTIVSGLVGIFGYLFNLYFNFKVVGKHG